MLNSAPRQVLRQCVAFRQSDIDRKSEVVAGRWYLEQQTVGVGRGLTEFPSNRAAIHPIALNTSAGHPTLKEREPSRVTRVAAVVSDGTPSTVISYLSRSDW